MLINGQLVTGKEQFVVLNPAVEDVITHSPEADDTLLHQD